ncbi:MAG: FAD-dependent oxidoreductase [Hyphomicrobiales bacterium]|nr:FAD-dependent oxidoreductase [Hyphomicrobiales bacterium]
MRRPTIHIIGAGFAGLSAAWRLSETPGLDIVVHESAAQAGGRRRSIFDEATSLTVDGGAEFVLTTWRATLAFMEGIGARAQWRETSQDGVAFVDMASGERWTTRPGAGGCPFWTLDSRRRPPRTRWRDYWPALRLLRAPPRALLKDYAPSLGPSAERVWRPFALTALNTELDRASARLAGAALREMQFGAARPLAPVHGLTRDFVEPALKALRRRGVAIRLERRLAALDCRGERVATLEFEHDRIDLQPGDAAILATPPRVAAALVPQLSAPTEFNDAIAVHFAISPPSGAPGMLGVVSGAFHWMIGAENRISVVIKNAASLIETPRETLAANLWRDVAALTGLSDATPAWRVVRQRRATFAATPEQDALRPPLDTRWRNLFLAGAYVQNGAPDSLESSVRSGAAAAERARQWVESF